MSLPPKQRDFSSHRLPRLYVDAALAEGQAVPATPEQTHYLRDVMRRAPGEAVLLFNGRDGEWRARLGQGTKHTVALIPETRTRDQTPDPDIWCLFAPIKRTHLDFMVEKLSELGAARLVPVMTRHTVADRVKTERLQAIAIEAAEQCERLSVPPVADAQNLASVLTSFPPDRILIFCAESGEAQPLGPILAAPPPPGLDWQRAAILTGPEGGFTPDERAQIRALPNAVAVGLGPRILRADTAAISALALWQSGCGDWHSC